MNILNKLTKKDGEAEDLNTVVTRKRNGYVAGVIAIVVVIFVLLNLIIAQLPSNVLELDLTTNSLYDISDVTVDFLSQLDTDIDIVMLSELDNTDERIIKYVDKYITYSDHLKYTHIDPVAHPSVLTEYEGSEANSIVVSCKETGKLKVIPFSDIIVTDWYSYLFKGGASESEFDADGQLTSAVHYVTQAQDLVVYTVTNHGEEDIPDAAMKSLVKANLDIQSVNLLMDGGIPEDCSELIFYHPINDLADDEFTMIQDYMNNGGCVYYIHNNQEKELKNFTKLLNNYGLEIVPGYIADTERYYQQYGSAYAVWATPATSSPVASQLKSDDLVLVLYGRGMLEVKPMRESIEVVPFLKTSEKGCAVTSEGETTNTYIFGAVSTDSSTNGSLCAISAYSLVDETVVTSFPNAVNLDLFVDAATTPINVDEVSIPSKNLEVTYNSVADPLPATIVFVGVLPLAFLFAGVYLWIKRRAL